MALKRLYSSFGVRVVYRDIQRWQEIWSRGMEAPRPSTLGVSLTCADASQKGIALKSVSILCQLPERG
jgi:hypothetical protein